MTMYPTSRFISFILISICFAVLSSGSPIENAEPHLHHVYPRAPATFTHPGVLVNKAQLDFVKAKVAAQANPWYDAYNAMLAHPLASSTRSPSPFPTVACGSGSMNPSVGCREERQDALAAYANALAWYISGNRSYATKAISFMNAWARSIRDHTDSNAPLQTGWSGASWARAAEIIRYSNAGWSSSDITTFENMLRNVYLPKIIGGSINNVMMEAAQGIAVFLNDAPSYDRAMAKFATRAPAYVYLTSDGSCPKAPPANGFTSCSQVQNFWLQYSFPENGITQETCRDFAHTGYGISSMSHIAETSKIQGTDLWTTDVGTRIRYALGFHSRYELGESVPSWLCGGSVDLKNGKIDFAITEVGYTALNGRLGFSMTNTGSLTMQNRPVPMSDHKGANRARIILEAVRLASSAEVPSLQLLIAREPNILQLELVLRILLTYLPESTEPKAYIDLLHQIACGAVHPPPQSSLRPVQHGKELSDNEVRYQVRRLHLLPLAEERDLQAGCTDLLSLFLIHRARKIDVETGSIPGVQELLEPFSNRDPYLRVWTVSNILPLRRLNYEYYPDVEDPYTLEALEHLEGRPAIDSLLARSARLGGTETIQCARDIRGVVGPWIYGESSPKRRKTHHDRRRTSFVSPTPAGQVESVEAEDFYTAWLDVHDWIVDLALRNFAAAAETLEQWDGPTDVDYDGYNDHEDLELDGWQTQTLRYAQAGLAIAYANSETTPSAFDKTSAVLRKVSQLSGLDAPPALDEIQTSNVLYVSKEYLDQLSEVHLLHNALLRPDNPVTSSTQASLSFASLVLRSCVLLQKLGNSKSCRVAAALAAFARPEEQMNELHKTLQKVPVKTRDDSAWAAVRQQILWLRDWQFQASGMGHGDGKESMGIFGKVKQMDAEVEILRALLRASCYDLAVHVYCMQDERPISKDALERTVLSVAMSFYDGASNGNRTRGGIRKASEMLAAFQSHFPQSQHFDQANALLAATHSISFYSLTLQHGVPFQPVNIRASKDPMSLIGKILEQNARSYTKLDDLIEIGRNLVGAKLGSARDPSSLTPGAATTDSSDDQEQKLHESSRRITSMAIEAALTEGDFDTAYSYIVN
ncbi:MAG: hypothetical protein Q9206_004124, partial [Seirophora lacunosa]